jgi:hypothetical protein
MVERIAPIYSILPATMKAQIHAESTWNPYAISYDDRGNPVAYGIAQFTMDTGREYGLHGAKDLFNPEKSMHAMGKLMSLYINKYRRKGYSVERARESAFIDYNCGQGCSLKNNDETRRYIARNKSLRSMYEK